MTKLPQVIEDFNATVKQTEVLLSIARQRALQIQACETLDENLRVLQLDKQAAIAAKDESHANLLLGCACVNRALYFELRMWLGLKDETPETAWDDLISAQEAAAAAARAHPGFHHLRHHVAKLEAIERLIFPPQVFISSGVVAKRQSCSICGHEYGECEHLAGRPYMGEFCRIQMEEVSADHVSIVDRPADKRCRITTFDVDGGKRNRMTWAVQAEDDV